MPTEHEFRLQFRQWLIRHDLDADVADAILESMPPFDWSEIARSDEVAALSVELGALRADVDRRFEQVDRRFTEVDRRFDSVDVRLRHIETDLRSFASDFHTMSRVVVFAVAAMAVTLAIFAIRVGLQVGA